MNAEKENLIRTDHEEFRFPKSIDSEHTLESVGINEEEGKDEDLVKVRDVIESLSAEIQNHVETPDELRARGIVSEKVVEVNGIEYHIRYVTKEFIGISFGEAYADAGVANVRDDLPERVKKFVERHELYHLTDPKFIPGDFMSEVRANLYPGLKDPLGLVLTLVATLRDPERRTFYKEFLKREFFKKR